MNELIDAGRQLVEVIESYRRFAPHEVLDDWSDKVITKWALAVIQARKIDDRPPPEEKD